MSHTPYAHHTLNELLSMARNKEDATSLEVELVMRIDQLQDLVEALDADACGGGSEPWIATALAA